MISLGGFVHHMRTIRQALAIMGLAVLASSGLDAAGLAETKTLVPPTLVQTALALDLTVDYDRPAIEGTATLTLMNVGKTSVGEAPLLLNRLMTIRDVTVAGGRSLAMTTAVSVFEDDPFKQVRHATVALNEPLAPGRHVTLRVRYSGPLVGYVETGSLYIKDRIDPEFTILRSDALAFPVVGLLSDAANRAMRRESFDFTAHIAVPDTQVVATGGSLVGTTRSGSRLIYEFSGKNVPFLNIAIAPYRAVTVDGVSVYSLPADAERAQAIVDAGRRAMARLAEWYGPLPSAPRVTVIEIPEGFGSQASATAGIILDARGFKNTAGLPQFYHELTHFWNAADLDVPSPRWNEGLAMYLQYRLARELDGFAGTAAAVEQARSRVCAPTVRADLERTPFARFGVESKTDYAYRVGFLMFTGLESLLTETGLDAAVRRYLQAHLAKGGTTEAFLGTLKGTETPRQGAVTTFLHDWFETSDWIAPVCAAASFEDAMAKWR